MSKCDKCQKETEIKLYAIKDEMGTRYRNLCSDCASQTSGIESFKANYTQQIEINNEPLKNIIVSSVYKIISIIIAIFGVILGIAIANTYPIQEIQYKYPSLQSGDTTITEKFNLPLMLYIWAGTAILFFVFWGVYCILKNQEKLLKYAEKIPEENQ